MSSAALAASARESELQRAIAQEQEKALQRRRLLDTLSEKERALNADLAALEKRVALLTEELGEKERELLRLETAQGTNRAEFEALDGERRRLEDETGRLILLLWPLQLHQDAMGAGQNSAWHEAEQRYQWMSIILRTLAKQREELEEKKEALKSNLSEKDRLALELKTKVAATNDLRDALLADVLRFNRELEHIRKERVDTEDALARITKTAADLNIRLQAIREGADIRKLKGELPWPARGKLVRRYAPGANPPVRGLGLALREKDEIRSVAAGKVVYNDILRGLGEVVILMHGREYYTVYAHLDDIQVDMGQEVPQGHVLGHAGFYPPANGRGLYFELRFHQKAINPDGWLGKQ